MGRYLTKRILLGLLSAFGTVALVMGILYSTMDRNLIFASDTVYQRLSGDAKTVYMYQSWEAYGYLDYVPYGDWLRASDADGDSAGQTAERFAGQYREKGYTVVELAGKSDAGNAQGQLFAYREYGVPEMLLRYFGSILSFDHVNKVAGDVGERKLTFTWRDPVYGGGRFAPAVLGSGTEHKYLLYFDDRFPFLHQNFVTVHLGRSVSVSRGVDVFDTMNMTQGSFSYSETIYPSGYTERSADDLHSAVYVEGSRASIDFLRLRYADDYTSVKTFKNGFSKVGYSFLIGAVSVVLSYLLALPISTLMALRQGKLWDILGSAFVAVMTAVPALAYIFLFKAVGGLIGLPVSFDLNAPSLRMLILPIFCIMLPSAAYLMKWNRRYAADQMRGDYVLFARACGAARREIVLGQILPNAAIPVVHGIPWSILSALTGAIITERVFDVPGAGNLLTTAINAYDNSVIVGLTLFYALISVTSAILGDLFMSLADPRISLAGGEGGNA